MGDKGITTPLGRVCGGVIRIHHVSNGVADRSWGPLELHWVDGGQTLLDTKSDWTLRIEDDPWSDPYAGRTPEELEVLRTEVGLWIREDVSEQEPYVHIVGSRVSDLGNLYNQMGEVTGVTLDFGRHRLRASMWDGELQVQVFPV